MFPPDPGPGQHLSRNARISASNIFVVNILEDIQSIFLIWTLERDEPLRAGGC